MTTTETSLTKQGDNPAYVEVYDEPLHPTVFNNNYVRVLKVACPAGQSTQYHRHAQDSFFLFFKKAQIKNSVMGKDPVDVELDAGSFYWGDHLSNPIIHQVCVGSMELDCMDVEFKADRPRPTAERERSKFFCEQKCYENNVMRAYRIKLAPHEAASAEEELVVDFDCLVVAMGDAVLSRGAVVAGDRWWISGHDNMSFDVNRGRDTAELMVLEPK